MRLPHLYHKYIHEVSFSEVRKISFYGGFEGGGVGEDGFQKLTLLDESRK